MIMKMQLTDRADAVQVKRKDVSPRTGSELSPWQHTDGDWHYNTITKEISYLGITKSLVSDGCVVGDIFCTLVVFLYIVANKDKTMSTNQSFNQPVSQPGCLPTWVRIHKRSVTV